MASADQVPAGASGDDRARAGVTQDFEKLGSFYLGRQYDLAARRRLDAPLLYDSKDLVTHAVCVGMTGSGKTGLCLGLLEEAAIDGIPAIIIDPKGDLGNLLLAFPRLSPEDFAPWINTEDARRRGLEPAAYAAQQAERWRAGLAEWGQDPARIQRLRDAAEFAIYTPGSTAGLAVSILKSFDAPSDQIVEDAELFQERIASTVTSLLGLVGVSGADADPLRSREHILLCTIFAHAWDSRENLDIGRIIDRIQKPPVTRIGVMEVETFFPSQDRFALAMRLNNLIAAPGFSRWLEGEPLDIGAMLYTPRGKPRQVIFSIAHLSDPERMFFVSLLLNQVLAWVRTQSGTSSLRAVLYMDEIAGYVPPVANPPSKQPLLTLMKQSRAFGLGMLLATQNPVDIDYKGLANAGTWFIGRLQTDRDKQRILDGLEGAAASAGGPSFDRASLDRMISQLSSRVFLLNNVHEGAPAIFETRWTLSYLRGPLTREQIRALSRPAAAPGPTTSPADGPAAAEGLSTPSPTPGAGLVDRVASPAARAAAPPAARESTSRARPVLPPEVPQYFIPARAQESLEYRPMLLGIAKIYYKDIKSEVDMDVPISLLSPINAGPVPVDWDAALEVSFTENDVDHEPAESAAFSPLLPDAGRPRSFEAWKKSLLESLYRGRTLELLRSPALGATSRPGENQRDFRIRLGQSARERRDQIADKLKARYAPRLAALEDRARRAEQTLAVQQEQAASANVSGLLSIGSAVLGAFLGRKVISSGTIGRAASAARGVGRSSREASDVDRARQNLAVAQEQLAQLEQEFQAELREASAKVDAQAEELQTISIRPRKTNITIRAVVLAWAPHTPAGERAW